MTEKLATELGINKNCLARVMRFVEHEMEPEEVMTFAAHFQDCFECRDFAENLRGMLDWRESIRTKLINREELRKE